MPPFMARYFRISGYFNGFFCCFLVFIFRSPICDFSETREGQQIFVGGAEFFGRPLCVVILFVMAWFIGFIANRHCNIGCDSFDLCLIPNLGFCLSSAGVNCANR